MDGSKGKERGSITIHYSRILFILIFDWVWGRVLKSLCVRGVRF